jgi:hypothetical protein
VNFSFLLLFQNYELPLTRLQKKLLAIEQNYDSREDVIYMPNTDWIGRWVEDAADRTLDGTIED